jgi:ABC-type uncharacterized transport system ATPase subunit
VVFITHKLGEVLEVADQVVVLRDGAVSGQCAVQGATRESLARLMVGREWRPPAARHRGQVGAVLLQVRSPRGARCFRRAAPAGRQLRAARR